MNLNIIAYGIYLIITASIILFVGKICFTNGKIFIETLLDKNKELANQINLILLVGYYLLNIGYCALTLINWNKIISNLDLINVLGQRISIIILLIGTLHYLNILLLNSLLKKTHN